MYNRIESSDNNRLKLVRKLQNRKHRDSLGKYVIEGINLVEEAVSRGVDIDFIIVSDDFESSRLDLACQGTEYEILTVDRHLYESVSEAQNGSGVLAVISKSSSDDALSGISETDNVLVLDRIQDPGNMGTMIRTAVAAGYSALILVKGTVDVYSSKVLRATAGMIFDIPIAYAEDAKAVKSMAEDLGLRLCVTEPKQGVPYYEAGLASGVALVIGNEGSGVSDEMIDAADVRITIPMEGRIESLNAAVAATILMYERIRQGADY